MEDISICLENIKISLSDVCGHHSIQKGLKRTKGRQINCLLLELGLPSSPASDNSTLSDQTLTTPVGTWFSGLFDQNHTTGFPGPPAYKRQIVDFSASNLTQANPSINLLCISVCLYISYLFCFWRS